MNKERTDERGVETAVQPEAGKWDHSTHEKFFEYYARESESAQALRRLTSIRDTTLKFLEKIGSGGQALEVADIGCGAGTQCLLWAEKGHRVHGVEVNAALLELAGRRAASANYRIDFRLGSALELPWANESIDVCLLTELLEHVADWKGCLRECTRVLRPGGILFLTTTNKLCPVQEEFKLPGYSWYPAPLKKYFERLATTTHPGLAGYAKYPAVNWFSFYSLKATLTESSFQSFDRFDLMDVSRRGLLARWIVASVRALPSLRWWAHVVTPGTLLLALKAHCESR